MNRPRRSRLLRPCFALLAMLAIFVGPARAHPAAAAPQHAMSAGMHMPAHQCHDQGRSDCAQLCQLSGQCLPAAEVAKAAVPIAEREAYFVLPSPRLAEYQHEHVPPPPRV